MGLLTQLSDTYYSESQMQSQALEILFNYPQKN